MMSNYYKYHYPVYLEADRDKFYLTCKHIEKTIPNLKKMRLLHDVDDSLIQVYSLADKDLIIVNNEEEDIIEINSQFSIKDYVDYREIERAS